jgi:hypothetical protein
MGAQYLLCTLGSTIPYTDGDNKEVKKEEESKTFYLQQ